MWSLNLATTVNARYTAVDCTNANLQAHYPPCFQNKGNGVPAPFNNTFIGVTGTPVIDPSTNILYAVAAMEDPNVSPVPAVFFYLFAVDITSGRVLVETQITGSVSGQLASPICTTSSGGGTVTFDSDHIQRSALLLLNGIVYVPFALGLEGKVSGWMFGYKYSSTGPALNQVAIFNTTADGTGGGIWMSGAGPASDGTSIFVVTGNGTFDIEASNPVDDDAGDTLLRLSPQANLPGLTRADYYAPSDILSYNASGRCTGDMDFGSGGVLLPPDFTYTASNGGCSSGCKVAINADKESKLWVANKDNLGGFNANGGNNIQTLLSPCTGVPCMPESTQGYWASPAYWHYNDGQDQYMLYYSATTDTPLPNRLQPLPINAYQLSTNASSGPLPTTEPPPNSTGILFCQFSPTPSGSWNGRDSTSGILWAVEHQNADNPTSNDCNGADVPHAALHAFSAVPTSGVMTKLYNNRGMTRTGSTHGFPTPTIFKGQVYMGTDTEVDVFGLCSTQQGGCLQ